MKKKIIYLLLSSILFVNSGLQAQGKIGYVSADEVFASMPEVRKADSSLAAFQQTLSETYQYKEDELNAAIEKFIKDSVNLTTGVKDARRKDLQDRITGLQSEKQRMNGLLDQEKEKQLKPIRQKMLDAIKEVAKENGYAHVLYKEQAIVSPEQDDITGKVKKKLGIK